MRTGLAGKVWGCACAGVNGNTTSADTESADSDSRERRNNFIKVPENVQ